MDFDITNGVQTKLLTDLPVAVVIASVRTETVVAVNDAATELFDRTRSSLIGSHQTELHPPELEEQHRELFKSAAEGNKHLIYSYEKEGVVIKQRDGTEVPVDVRTDTIENNDETYLVGLFEDARDRLARIKQLTEQSTAIESSPAGIAILGPDGTYNYMNQAHAELFGYETPEKLVDDSWRQFYDDERVAEIETKILPVIEETGNWDGELTAQRRDGSEVVQRVSLATLPNGGLTCVAIDLSKREQTRQRLAEVREFSEGVVLSKNIDQALTLAINTLTNTVDQQFVGYWQYDEDTDQLRPVELSTTSRRLINTEPTFKSTQSLAGQSFAAAEPSYHPDLSVAPPRYDQGTDLSSQYIVPVGEYGVLIVGSRKPEDFSKEDRELIRIVSRHLQTALLLIDERERLRSARERAEAHEAQLERVIDTVPQLIFAKNTDGEFILANEAVADAYGTTTESLVESTDSDFSASEDEVDAFTEDDQTVIETGETLYRNHETLTDSDGTERILETWKIPFDPVERDEDAVLGVANDITELVGVREELRRQKQLHKLTSVSNELLQTSNISEAFSVCVDAIEDAVSEVHSIAIYQYDDGTLHKQISRATSGFFQQKVEPGENPLWQVIGADRSHWINQDELESVSNHKSSTDDFQVLATSIGKEAVVTVCTKERTEETRDFITAIANQTKTAITRMQQEQSIQNLSGDITEASQRADRHRRIREAFVESTQSVIHARTREDVEGAILRFGTKLTDYVHVARYDPVEDRLEITGVSSEGGPAKLYSRDKRFPAVTAAAEATTQFVEDTNTEEHAEWLRQLLYFGYRRSLAVPLTSNDTVYGVCELVSASGGDIDQSLIQTAEVLGMLAGSKIDSLEIPDSSDQEIHFTIECHGRSLLLPNLPDGCTFIFNSLVLSDEEIAILRGEVTGLSSKSVRTYLSQLPGIEIESLEQLGTDLCEVRLRIVGSDGLQFGRLFNVVDGQQIKLAKIRCQPNLDVFNFQTNNNQRVAETRSQLESLYDSCSLRTKELVDRDVVQSETDTSDLTQRQKEIFEFAIQQGYYATSREISGAELAEQLDISSSTLHQHLRAIEQKVMHSFFQKM